MLVTVEVNPEPLGEDGLDITAMVGLAGSLCGVLLFVAHRGLGAKMASTMLGMEAQKAASRNVGRVRRNL